MKQVQDNFFIVIAAMLILAKTVCSICEPTKDTYAIDTLGRFYPAGGK